MKGAIKRADSGWNKLMDAVGFNSRPVAEGGRRSDIPVVLCIGSDKVTGDILGPEAGRRLIEEYGIRAYVYGVTGRSVNGANIDKYDGFIREMHADSPIIAVDACLGAKAEIGNIKISGKGIGAGLAVRKSEKRYGDIGVVGIVAENSEDNVMQLISAEYDKVKDLSARVAEYVASNLVSLTAKAFLRNGGGVR